MVSPQTTANTPVSLTWIDGQTEIPLMLLKVRDDKGRELPGAIKETLTAAVGDSPLADWLEPSVQEDWSRGVGIDYGEAIGVTCRVPGYAIPAGAATSMALPGDALTRTVGNSPTPLVAIEEYGSDLFVGQEGDGTTGGRVVRLAGGTGAPANSLLLGAGRRLRDLVNHGGYLYAVSDNGTLGAGELHRTTDGVTWSRSGDIVAFPANGGAYFATARTRTVKVNWTTLGVPGTRLVSIDGPRTIAYTKPGTDPMLLTSWVTGVETGTGFSLVDLAAARKHVWMGGRDGLFDMDEVGNSPNLMGYETKALSAGIPFPVEYLNQYVYVSLGYQLDRVYVGQPGALQEVPGHCAPGLDTAAENEWHGYVTAMCSDQGWLVAAVYNPVTFKTGVFWGKDRSILRVDTPNPLVWHGPEVHSIAGYRVTKAKAVGLGGSQRLWLGALNVSTFVPSLDWVSLPSLGAPLDDLLSSGYHTFATGASTSSIWQRSCSLRSLGDTGGDKASLKIPYITTYGTRGLPANDVTPSGTDPYLVVYSGQDFAPGVQTWGAGQGVIHSPLQPIAPSVTSGQKLYDRIDFFSPNGTALPPIVGVLDSVRRERWRTVTAFRVLNLDVEYGPGVSDLANATDDSVAADAALDGRDTTSMLLDVTKAPPTVLRLPDDSRWSVKLRQVFDAASSMPHGKKRMQARLQVALIEQLS